MRCLTLAQELHRKGCLVQFICRAHPGHLANIIAREGFQVSLLPEPGQAVQARAVQEDYAAWLGVSQEQDAKETIDAFGSECPEWLAVDHYGLDRQWESLLRPYISNLMVIDDLANRPHFCDLLLDQNYFREPEERYKGLLPEHCDTLLGPKYALLRPEFREARKFCRMRGGGIARVLIYFGGNDPDNLTGMALEALSDKSLSHLLVDAVVGPNNQYQEKLEKQVEQRPGTRLHIQPENFTELMLRADLCIGAGGTTTWERLCLRLPSLVITVAENQEPFTAELDRDGLVTWIGRKGEVTDSDISTCLINKINKFQSQEINSCSPSPVDGFGALRVAEKLFPSQEKELNLRKACHEDTELFYFWTNDPVVRENSFQKNPISWKEHASWFKNKLNSPYSCLWVLQISSGLPVGQVRFDIQNDVADIDYSLDAVVRGRGWGQMLLKMGLTEFKQLHQNIPCQGRVKEENQPSRHCFQRLGFIEKTSGGGQCYSLAIVSDPDSWINAYIPGLLQDWLLQGHSVLWVHNPKEIPSVDFCFMLGCGQMIPQATLDMFKHNLVIHESDLPIGKGWSPLTWQILEGKNQIPVTMIEAEKNVDSGVIYAQEWIDFQGHELVEELRVAQAQATIRLCKKFVREYPEIVDSAREQRGEESFYPKRKPEDSRLDPDQSIREQFNLLRVVDNERYPAFFDMHGQRYILKIEKKKHSQP
jgi:UDP-2,4-diacetamido-2,4,6-trideoxy-beta-L-altropyranose hydrolase